ncbi:uncharacterized protein [Chiloscyllium punctatum]|uniref:Galectin n=1 Tax=Chiloscyllium punctatum TaxID=137246 RepID=A0A401SR48_CHIPU|nr:hypothetical protein [Chiloscyllium punctatum]
MEQSRFRSFRGCICAVHNRACLNWICAATPGERQRSETPRALVERENSHLTECSLNQDSESFLLQQIHGRISCKYICVNFCQVKEQLEDALGPDFSNANKLQSGGVSPQPGWPNPQPGWPSPQPGWPSPQPGWPSPQSGWPSPQPGPGGQMPPASGSPGAPNQPGQGYATLPVPYDLPIPGGWQPGRMVKVVGTVKMNAEKFVINVCCGQDIVFHFSARFREAGFHQVMVRNSRISNDWGTEERDAPRFPFKYGERFEVLILGEPNQYKLAANNQHLLEFKHRYKTLQDVTKVSTYGEIDLHAMSMI